MTCIGGDSGGAERIEWLDPLLWTNVVNPERTI
jgi:hypothetical protein